MPASTSVTVVLSRIEHGDVAARDQLWPLVYAELHELARRAIAKERSDHTLQATALVHEAYLRLVDQERIGIQGRTHFFATAAAVIRHVLVDHARGHRADKRGGGRDRLTLSVLDDPQRAGGALTAPGATAMLDLLALDEALQELSGLDARQARVVELRFFGGLDVEETAQVLEVSPRTVKGDWRVARAWLRKRLEEASA